MCGRLCLGVGSLRLRGLGKGYIPWLVKCKSIIGICIECISVARRFFVPLVETELTYREYLGSWYYLGNYQEMHEVSVC
jgi:hypothetical protein